MNLHLEVWFSLYRCDATLPVLFLFSPVLIKAHAYLKGISWVNKAWKTKYRGMFLAATHDLLFLLYKITESNKKKRNALYSLLCGNTKSVCKELMDPSSFSKPIFASQISVVLLQPCNFLSSLSSILFIQTHCNMNLSIC